MEPPAPDRILRIGTVLNLTGLSRATLYRKIQEGTFPRQIQITSLCVGWRESAVCAWLDDPMRYRACDQNSA